MKTRHSRIFCALLAIAVAQVACSQEIRYHLNVFVYEDLNSNGTQDIGEPGIPNISMSPNITTNSEGYHLNYRDISNDICPPSLALPNPVTPPTGFKVTEYSFNENWNCSPPAWGRDITLFNSPYYAEGDQTRDTKIGLAPIFSFTKSPSPSTFTAAGETITYTFLIGNPRGAVISNSTLTDPALGLTNSVCTGAIQGGRSASCTAQYVTTEADVTAGSIVNTATASIFIGETSVDVEAEATVQLSQTVEDVPTFNSTVLSGQFSVFCDPNHLINFRVAEGTDTALVTSEIASGNLVLTIADQDISRTCQVTGDQRIMNCRYPGDIQNYPAAVVLNYNGTTLIQFPFYGEICTQTSTGDTGNDSSSTVPAACVTDPASFECFCAENPGADEDC